MVGSDRVRFCSQCQLNVFNLSAMSRDQAEALLVGTEGRLCVRFYRRRDGSILTQDCPVGLRKLKQRASRIRRAFVSALFGFLAGAGGSTALNRMDLVPSPGGNWGPTQGVMVAPESKRPDTSVVGELVSEPPLRHNPARNRRRG